MQWFGFRDATGVRCLSSLIPSTGELLTAARQAAPYIGGDREGGEIVTQHLKPDSSRAGWQTVAAEGPNWPGARRDGLGWEEEGQGWGDCLCPAKS